MGIKYNMYLYNNTDKHSQTNIKAWFKQSSDRCLSWGTADMCMKYLIVIYIFHNIWGFSYLVLLAHIAILLGHNVWYAVIAL